MVMFTVPGKPQGKARPRFARIGNHVRTYTPKETVEYERRIREAFWAAAPSYVITGKPCGVIVMAYFPIPSSASKKKRWEMEMGFVRPTVKPDGDNILKAVKDSLSGVFYIDDKQVVSESVQKYYAPEGCLKIVLYEVEAEQIE